MNKIVLIAGNNERLEARVRLRKGFRSEARMTDGNYWGPGKPSASGFEVHPRAQHGLRTEEENNNAGRFKRRRDFLQPVLSAYICH